MKRHQKNWMPVADDSGQFIYQCDPTVRASPEGGKLLAGIPPFAAENFSGGSQLIPFHGGYLALIHEAIQSPQDGKRCYQHRFVWFDEGFTLQKCSHRFFFQENNQIEFAAGMCWHPDGERLILSYGIRDAEAWVATVVADEVYSLLDRNSPHNGNREKPQERGAEVLGSKPTPRVQTQPPHADPLRYNQPLLSMAQVTSVTANLLHRGLPQHPDVWKNWDTWLAINACEKVDKSDPIIDAGGTRESAFLPGLAKLGYTNLININLDERNPGGNYPLIYLRDDITDANILDSSVAFVACLSVIEHGVDWRKFLTEMARILRPGGQLCLSFDYWETPIDCRGQMAFGASVKIFDLADVREMVDYAAKAGLALTGGELDLRCRATVVSWLGLDFTFLCLLFQRAE